MGIEGAGHQNDLTFDLNSTVWENKLWHSKRKSVSFTGNACSNALDVALGCIRSRGRKALSAYKFEYPGTKNGVGASTSMYTQKCSVL